MKRTVIVVLLLALAAFLVACGNPAVEQAIQEAAPTLEAAAEQLAPTLEAAATELGPTLEAAAEELAPKMCIRDRSTPMAAAIGRWPRP